MSDISLHFTPLDLVLLAFVVGWPGGVVGAALGALAWKRRRVLGGLIGAAIGCAAFAAGRVLLK